MTRDYTVSPATRREEDRRLVTGRGTYVGDLTFEGMLDARFVRSHEAHGLLGAIDRADAEAMPGVVAVYTAAGLGSLSIDVPPVLERSGMAYPVLARDRVRFAGEALAMVVADRPELAEDAAEWVVADITPLRAVVDPGEALRDEVLLFPEAGTNVAVRRTIGSPIDRAREGIGVVQFDVASPRVDPMTLEGFGAVAVPGDDGTVTLWCSSGTPLLTRNGVAAVLGMAPERLIVRVPDVGGAFGQRGGFRPEHAAVVAAAIRLGRPVRWLAARREQLVAGDHGRDLRHRVRVGYSDDGAIRFLDVRILANLGAYPHRGWFIPLTAVQLASGSYRAPEITVSAEGVVTNTSPTGPYRGAGRPEAGLAIEQAVEEVARATGLSPDEVRARNFVAPDAMPITTPTGLTHDGGDYRALLRRARRLTEERAALRRTDGGWIIGSGVASFVETTAGSHQSGEYGRVEIRPHGVEAYTGSVSSGQGHLSVWPRVVAAALGVEPDDVAVISGDTSRIPEGTGTFGSRSAAVGAVALSRAASAVREMLLRRAASMLEASVDDLTVGRGGVAVRGVPGSGLALGDIAAAAEAAGEPLAAEELFVPDGQPLASGCYGAVVGVDPETGDVAVLDLIAVDDCGVRLSPMIVRGQVHGGIAQGLGQAMWERVVYTADGQPLSSTLMDYLVPSAVGVPSLTLDHEETPTPFNHLGVKGVGEAGTIGVPPAILAAVRDALAGLGGSPDLELPLLGETVWRALGR